LNVIKFKYDLPDWPEKENSLYPDQAMKPEKWGRYARLLRRNCLLVALKASISLVRIATISFSVALIVLDGCNEITFMILILQESCQFVDKQPNPLALRVFMYRLNLGK
jgi:hypothetical protein